MRYIFRVSFFLVAWVLYPAMAQCTKDSDCKGDRICVNGQCVDPSEINGTAVAPQPMGTERTTIQVEPGRPSADIRQEESQDAPGGYTMFIISRVIGLGSATFLVWGLARGAQTNFTTADDDPPHWDGLLAGSCGFFCLSCVFTPIGIVKMVKRLKWNAQHKRADAITEQPSRSLGDAAVPDQFGKTVLMPYLFVNRQSTGAGLRVCF